MWKRLTGEHIEDIQKTIISDILSYPEIERNELEFYVGADSQRTDKKIKFVTAIALYNKGKGGLGYYLPEIYRNMENRDRLWTETYKAVESAQWLNKIIQPLGLRVNEVHADLNPDKKHFSNSLVQICLGYICGMGFDGKIKPEAWVASSVANGKTK